MSHFGFADREQQRNVPKHTTHMQTHSSVTANLLHT